MWDVGGRRTMQKMISRNYGQILGESGPPIKIMTMKLPHRSESPLFAHACEYAGGALGRGDVFI